MESEQQSHADATEWYANLRQYEWIEPCPHSDDEEAVERWMQRALRWCYERDPNSGRAEEAAAAKGLLEPTGRTMNGFRVYRTPGAKSTSSKPGRFRRRR